jgi:hypothetical protein
MGNRSVITLNQVLHGYRNGHQLLASSCELKAETKRLLLFQSDLSGPLSTKNFDTYITGYPIKEEGLYAFAKSWYAYEMQRPGCVWTQTLLINFSDIGKFVDFSMLLNFFSRPEILSFKEEDYSNQLEVDIKQSYIDLGTDDIAKKSRIAKLLYNYPQEPIFISSHSSTSWDRIVISLWNDQWPRLRRNFSYCTGALDIKEINGKLFDLQIIPEENTYTLSIRQRNLADIYKAEIDNFYIFSELNFSNDLRKFLWLVGSDIPGTRANYLKLITIYSVHKNEYVSLSELIGVVSMYFPKQNEAKTIKKLFFGRKSILLDKFKEIDLIKTLIRSKNFDSINTEELEINQRLLEQIYNNSITLSDFVLLWIEAPKGRLDINLWNLSAFSYNESINEILKENTEVLDIVLDKHPKISELSWIWESDLSFQRIVYEKVKNNPDVILNNIIQHVLSFRSLIIKDIYEHTGKEVIEFSLDWLNESTEQRYFTYEWQLIISNNHNTIKKWLYSNRKFINIQVYQFIYKILNHEILFYFNLPIDFWTRLARVATYNKNLYLATSALAVGFHRKDDGGEWIISESFKYVYDSASQSSLRYEHWKLIPKESYDEIESNWISNFISILSYKTRNRIVQDWDYCEILIRSLVNLYLKYPLNKQAFVQTLDEDYLFYRAVEYCINLRKGQKFLVALDNISKKESFVISKFQRKTLKRALH